MDGTERIWGTGAKDPSLFSLASGLVRMVVAHWLEVDVQHGVLGRDSLGVVVPEHLAQKVESLIRNQLIVLGVDKFGPGLAWDVVVWQQIFVVGIECQPVLVEVGVELLSAEDFGDLDKLVVVVTALEEGLALEDHTSEHAAEGPDIERVIVGLEVDEQLGSFEVARGDADIVLLARVVEFSQTPIDETKLAVGVVDHDVVRFDIAMHNALGVTVVEGLEDLEHVVADVEIVEALVKLAEVGVTRVDKLSDDGGRLSQRVPYHVDQLNDVHSVLQGLEDLNLTPNFVLLDCQIGQKDG